ncbi:MAG: hypothetical protein FD123_124 [Bacteroidetes bacterium]|nr:MAG: hypothetical protein FD123_124 [Bacteroidota bacterium]
MAALIFFASACSQKKNTVVTRGYHNLTSRYNGYFYAKESIKEGLDKLNRSYEDDYSQILPLFRLPNSAPTKGCYADMDKTIKKSSTVIERHAITDRGGTEIAGAVKWIDDNYLLIGRARYYKGELLSALQTFEYVSRKYEKELIRYDGYLWQARTHIELGGFSQAMPLLDLINNDGACPEELKGEIKATYADLYIREGNYSPAAKELTAAIALTKNKKIKARYTYVLGQLYQQLDNTKKASECFAQVISMNPTYDMLFNAKVNRARMSGADPKFREQAKKDIEKLLKDPKNKEYYDQLYYALGEIDQRAKKEDMALKYYKLSTASSMGNDKQKAVSFLAIADIYFNRVEYTTAQVYYDSTMQVLPKDYPGYTSIDDKRKSLNNLVKFLKVIQLEDSVQNVVNMYGTDTTKLYPYIDKLIEKVKEQEKKAEVIKEQNGGGNFSPLDNGGNGGGGNTQSAGTWYWYNPSTISFGTNEFLRKWGNRKLEDNWRRANKETVMEDGSGDGDGGDSAKTEKGDKGKIADNKTRAYYMKNLPVTQELLDKSNEKIADAYYNVASIYKEQLRNNPKSIDAFDKLTSRFPKHKYALPSHYQLYRLYLADKNQPKATFHSDYILKNYPESEYAKILTNPNYEVNANADRERVNKYYNETFAIYKAGNYNEVLARCTQADSTFGRNHLSSRFDYMRALSLGHTQGVDAMAKALTQIIIKHPKDAVKDEAQALLDRIKGGGNSNATKIDSASLAKAGFKDVDNTEFQYMVIVESGKGSVNKFRNAVSDFNNVNYSANGISVNSLILDPGHQLILVKPFTSKKGALDYLNHLQGTPAVFKDLQPATYQVFAISTENFTIFFKDKDIPAYKKFYEENVVKKSQ